MNLSSVSLTPLQIQNCGKGLKFTTTPQRTLPKMEKDIKYFTRNFRLVEFFPENPEFNTPDSSLVKNKPIFCASQKRNRTLEPVIKLLQKQNFSEENLKNKSNVSKHKCQDILNSKKNKNIIIRETYKGVAVVIMYIKN